MVEQSNLQRSLVWLYTYLYQQRTSQRFNHMKYIPVYRDCHNTYLSMMLSYSRLIQRPCRLTCLILRGGRSH